MVLKAQMGHADESSTVIMQTLYLEHTMHDQKHVKPHSITSHLSIVHTAQTSYQSYCFHH